MTTNDRDRPMTDLEYFKRIMRDLSQHGLLEFDPESPQEKNFRMSPSFRKAMVHAIAQHLSEPNPPPFRDCIIEGIVATLTIAYAETPLKKEQLGERLMTLYPLIAEQLSEAISHLKPPGYEALIDELRIESLARPAKVQVTGISAENISKKLQANPRIYA
jgi:hypothetical protein